MSDRPTDGGENHGDETYIAYSGRCRILASCSLICVEPPPDSLAYIVVTFEAGEEHAYDRMQWRNKDGSHGGGFVVRTGDGDAHLMPYLFERVCEVIGGRPRVKVVEVAKVEPVAEPLREPVSTASPPSRPIRVINVKGLNKPEQRANIVYVGRKFAGWPEHELHNQFKPKEGEPVGECLRKYKARLLNRLTLEEDLTSLWEECRCGARPLGCWCCNAVAGDGSEVVCHGQVLAEMLRERFGVK